MKNIFNKMMIIFMVVLTCTTVFNTRGVRADDNSDLSGFITSVSIKDSNNNEATDLIKDETYNISISFAEKGTEGAAEMNTPSSSDATLTYDLPNIFTAITTSGNIDIKVNDTNTVPATYKIENNKITLTISHSSDHYSELASASNLKFELALQAKLSDNASSGEVKFGEVTKNITVKDVTPSVALVKNEPYYDKANGVMKYTVTATATGHPKNVVITDSISGTALTFSEEENYKLSVTSNKNTSISQEYTKNTNGFTYNINEMSNGEVLTFTYYAKIDYSKLSADSTKFTTEMTNNTVSAKVDSTDQNSASSSYTKDAYTAVSKSSTGTSTSGNTQTTTWKIKINEDCLVSMAGKEITDTLSSSNVSTKYSGTGITINKYTKGSTTVTSTETKNWSDVGVSDTSTATEFKYTLPTESDGNIYWYEITYTTETDISSLIGDTTISNTAKALDQESNASANVTVGENGTWSISKTHDSSTLTSDNVDYTVTVNIPKNGFSSLTITDELPYTETWVKENNTDTLKFYSDTLKTDSIKLKIGDTELTKDTDYTVSYTEPKVENNVSTKATLKIEITKNAITSHFGSSTEGRALTITYSTKPSETWGSNKTRTNNVTVKSGDIEKKTSDSYTLIDQSISKAAKGCTTGDGEWSNLNNKNYKGFAFYVVLTGVNSDSVEFTDTYNTELFTLNLATIGGTDDLNTANNYVVNDNVTNSVIPVEGGSKITFTPTKKTDDTYYSYYRVVYVLSVKDENAWSTIKNGAISNTNNKYTIENTAKWGDNESKATYDYEYQPLDKSGTVKSDDPNTTSYTITVNKDALQLNSGNKYTIKDELSIENGTGSVTYDTSSFVYKVDGTESNDIKATFADNLMSFEVEVPDGKKIEITYDVKVSSSGTVKYANTLSANDKYSKTASSLEYKDSSSGSASTYSFTIQKLDNETKEPIQGATYQLYHLENDGTYKALTDKDKNNVTFTTDENGKSVLSSQNSNEVGWTIYSGSTYKLVETSAPSGYKLGEDKVFTIAGSDTSASDKTGELIYNNGVIYVYDSKTDENELTTDLTLSVAKKVEVDSNSATSSSEKEFKFNLYKSDENGACKDDDLIQTKSITMSAVSAGSESTSSAVSFDSIKELTVGTHYYAIKEVSDETANWTFDSNTYVIKVVVAKNDDNTALTKTITIGDTTVDSDPTVTFTNSYKSQKETGTLVITKTIEGDVTKEEAEGKLEFTVTDSNSTSNTYKLNEFTYNETNKKWTKTLTDVTPGTYTIKETVKDIDGKDVSVTYAIDSNSSNNGEEASASVTANNTTIVAFNDAYTNKTYEVEISKVDATSKEELPGASLKITKDTKDGEQVASWTSTSETHKVKLTQGTYVLTETSAPNGYEIAESITFTVTSDGKIKVNDNEVDKVTMEDKVSSNKIKISKVDITNNEELAGAELKITKEGGTQVTSWTSTNEVHEVELSDGTYTLTETTAPNGYRIAESITFTVTNGKVSVDGKEVDKNTVVMKDARKEGTLIITKTIKGDVTKEEAEGSISFTVTNSDKSFNETYKLDSFTYDASTNKWTKELNVKPDTYTVEETVKDIEGRILSTVSYKLNNNEEEYDDTASVEISDNTTSIVAYTNTYEQYSYILEKQDIDTGDKLQGATYKLQKYDDSTNEYIDLYDSNNTLISFTTLSNGQVEISDSGFKGFKLTEGTYKLVEIKAPTGYSIGESKTFTISGIATMALLDEDDEYPMVHSTIVVKDSKIKESKEDKVYSKEENKYVYRVVKTNTR